MSRAATRRVLLVVALLLGCFVYWHLMLRWFFLQRDDFWLVTISDEPSGRFGAGDFFWHWWHDWAQRNGRSSDAVVRLMLRPGTAAMAWIAPAILTACSAALWRWLPRGEGRAVEAARARDSVVPRLLLLTVVPVLGLTIPEVAGNTVFWAAGIGNYVIPTGLAVLAASWLVRPPTTPWMTGVAVLTVVAAGVLHEMAAVTVFVITHVWWLLHRRRVPGRGVVLIAASYGGLLLGFSGPGRWRRMDALVGEETGLLRWASSAARYTSEILLQAGPVWLALALAVSLAAVVARRAGTVTGGPGLWVALSGLWVSGGAAWWLARS